MRENDYIPTILIVDDMAANIAILSDLLQSSYKIKIAKNGQRALDIARGKEKPDLILLDIEMPQMSGYEVCKKLKDSSDTRNIPVIFVTAKNDTTDEEYGLKLGAIDYIKKPFHPAIIKIRVRNHINLKLKSDKLEELSMCDSLTGIPNRRYFDETLEKKHKEVLRDKKSLAVIMIDIDFFKLYNDNYGHWKGDECLAKVATTLRKTLKRPTDTVSRYGGEEFIILLKDIDKDGAKKVAESLVNAVAELKIPHEYSPVTNFVTISAGVAIKEENETISKEELLKIADDELYRAKESGRNRFCAGF
ncbi:MAG: diguanylate cyclase [Sulfurimonas sp.]|uniref:GGDEF domain-containing response regulator n=1 Tax=Sulfurimonas sp. TaxID=2022749 RepID=UPI0026287D8B|nr:diguanylate cyclase [Sulfurimonas sp.]MDD5400674.1 diguanylate cyclase [Sulfurimonas sp.]